MVDVLDLWAKSVQTPPHYASRVVEGWPLVFRTLIRFADIDLLGHVNNVIYGTYFEEARMDFLRWLWNTTGINPSIIVAHLEMDFHRPLYLHEAPVIAVRVCTIGRSRFDLEYCLLADDAVCEGRTVNIWYNYATGKPAPLPDTVRAAISTLGGEQTPV